MKIIVSTDFSELSKVALIYATHFASRMDSQIILMNNVVLESVPRAGVLINIEAKMETSAMAELNALASWAKSLTSPSPEFICVTTRNDNSVAAIIQQAQQQNADLIIMGTKGASGFTSTLLGSVCDGVIRKSTVPVISVPSTVVYATEGTFVLAVDPDSPPDRDKLNPFMMLCKLFLKKAEFLFAVNNDKTEKIEVFNKNISEWFPVNEIEIHTREGIQPEKVIQEFIQSNTCALLALVPSRHSYFERISGKSFTTKIIEHSSIPVLTLP